MAKGRVIAIGDIHGCSAALEAIVDAIGPRHQDTIVTLGDYVDRGIDSKGVLDQMIALAGRCRLVPILGNHDEMMLDARNSQREMEAWLYCGGEEALESYYGPRARLHDVPPAHFDFLASCRDWYRTDRHLFVHANYRPELPLDCLDGLTLRWLSLDDYTPPEAHRTGLVAMVGHTPQPSGRILDLGYLMCLDTACCEGGWLTALDVTTGRIWQADQAGRIRR